MQDTDYIDVWLTHQGVSRGRTAGTISAYRLRLRRLEMFLGDREKTIVDATYRDLEEFSGMYLHQQGVAPRSRRPSIAAIRGIYAWLHQNGVIRENPAARIEPPKVGVAIPDAMSLRHFESLFTKTDLSTFRGLRDAAILAVLGGCGLRASGVAGLDQEDLISDVGPDGWEVAVMRVKEKGGNQRFVPVPDDTFLLLRAYLAHDSLKKIDRTTQTGSRVLFVSTGNRTVPEHEYYGEKRRLGPNGIWRIVQRYGRLALIPEEMRHPHALRHMFGRELAEGGVGIDQRAALLGHRDVETTRIYDRMCTGRLREAVKKSGPMSRIRTPVTGLRDMLRRSPRDSG